MRNKLFRYSVTGFIFVGIFGTLAHFFYEWSGYNKLVGLFCAVNESSWEHLKLLFFPYFVWSLIEYLLLKRDKCVFFSKAVGAFVGMISVLAFFYTYTGIIGKNIDWLNILSFFLGEFIAFLIDYIMIKTNKFCNVAYNSIGIGFFIFTSILFILFSFMPPLIPLFKDPISQSYGI